MKQSPTEHCDVCKRRVVVTRETDYEFTWECGHYSTSWAHAGEPPEFEASDEQRQQGLFE